MWTGALVTAKGPNQRPAPLAKVDASIPVPRGSYTLKVRPSSACFFGNLGSEPGWWYWVPSRAAADLYSPCFMGRAVMVLSSTARLGAVCHPAPSLTLLPFHLLPRPCSSFPPGGQRGQAGCGSDCGAAVQRRQLCTGPRNVSLLRCCGCGLRAALLPCLAALLSHEFTRLTRCPSAAFRMLVCSMNNHLDPGSKYA